MLYMRGLDLGRFMTREVPLGKHWYVPGDTGVIGNESHLARCLKCPKLLFSGIMKKTLTNALEFYGSFFSSTVLLSDYKGFSCGEVIREIGA